MENSNDLYSVIIQTSGVIVAIVGGFLTSAIVTLSARRTSLFEEIADLRQQSERHQREATASRTAAADARSSWRHTDSLGSLASTQAASEQAAQRLVWEARDHETRAEQADARIAFLDDRLRQASVPSSDITLGLTALALLAITGIVVPLLFMLVPFDDGCLWWQGGVVGLFTLGLVAIFAYFAFLIRSNS